MSSESPFEDPQLEEEDVDPDAAFVHPDEMESEYIVDETNLPPIDDEDDEEDAANDENEEEEENDDAEAEAVVLDACVQSWTVHTDSVYCVAFHPTHAGLIASGGGDEVGYLLTVGEPEPNQKLTGHKDSVCCAAFSRDGKYLALASLDATLSVWDPTTGKQLSVLEGAAESIECFVWHERGPVLFAGAGDGTGWLWNVQTQSIMNVFSGHGDRINDAAFTPDGKRIVTVSDDTTLRVWDPKTAACLYTVKGYNFHENPATSVACSADNKTCLSAGLDHNAYISNILTGKSIGELKGHTESIEDTAFAVGFPWALTASMDGRVGLWDLTTLQNRLWMENSDHIGITRMSSFGSNIFTGDVRGRISMFDSRVGGGPIKKWQAHSDAVMDLCVSSDGKRVVSCSDDHTIKVFDL